MLFNSPGFLFVFLPVVLLLYFCTPRSWRNLTLLGISFLFYAVGEPKFVFVVLLSALFDWFIARLIFKFRSTKPVASKMYLILGIINNVGILAYFKYTNLFFDTVNRFLTVIHIPEIAFIKILLPIGVSFVTFEKITYIVDIFRGIGKPSGSLVDYLTYVFLFPKLLAGPIIKYHDIADQLKLRTTNWENISQGLTRFCLGLAKKVFIADSMGEIVETVFNIPIGKLSFGYAWLGLICFTIQIFFDFSAYSDMAIGLARVFGFNLRENFNKPYISQSFTEFWQRWHISLSSWIKEYVYIPLGGNRGPKWRTYFNLWLAFLLSGAWHGAHWNLILWGVYQGIFIVLDKVIWKTIRGKLPQMFNVAFNFFLIMLGWAIFRSESIGYAIGFIKVLFNPLALPKVFVYVTTNVIFFLVLGLILSFLPLSSQYQKLSAKYACLRWRSTFESVSALVLLILAIGKISSTVFNPFLYFHF